MNAFVHNGLASRVIFGHGTIAALEEEVARLGCQRALLLSTPGQALAANEIADQLRDRCVGVYSRARMHTPTDITEDAVATAMSLRADCIVAFGGGSTIGLSKAIALRTDLVQLVLPTTYSGSEMTSIVGETANGVKTTKRTLKVLPEVVLYDVELTLTVPSSVAAGSGMNAIAHAAEALYSRNCSPLVSLMAEEGIASLNSSLPRIVADANSHEGREGALYGAWLCGSCLGMADMALHHKLCHVLGGSFGLPHAQTHAILLPHTISYNARAAPHAMQRLARALGASDASDALYRMNEKLGLPSSLREIGLEEGSLGIVADLAMNDRYWNPQPIERTAIVRLLNAAFAGRNPHDANCKI